MCLCCTTLRGVTYFMVNIHMLATFALFVGSAYYYLFMPATIPEGLENINPIFIQHFPLVVAGYGIAAAFFSCFIYRAIDMESLLQLTMSVVAFGGFQFFVMFIHLIFFIWFRDLVSNIWQLIFAVVLVGNFFATMVYLTILFLYGKKIHYYKTGRTFHNTLGNNNITLRSAIIPEWIWKRKVNNDSPVKTRQNPPTASPTERNCDGTINASTDENGNVSVDVEPPSYQVLQDV